MRIRRKPWAESELKACPFCIQEPDKYKGRWSTTFKNQAPIYLELGCGKGGFISQIAPKHPDINFIAVDMVDSMLGLAKRSLEDVYKRENVPTDNIRIFIKNVEYISQTFGNGDSVDRIYINFCNPWDRKKKHRKRRLTHPRQLKQYLTFLAPNGEIHFKTDNDVLFRDSIEYFKEMDFNIKYITYDLHDSGYFDNYVTEHESMFSEEGIKIKFLIAERSPLSDEEKLLHCYYQVRSMTDFVPKVALVLGSGLGDFAESLDIIQTVDYEDIEGFPVSTVQGHRGRFMLGYLNDVPVIAMQGRVHYYEGYSMKDVVLPIRLMKMLGAEILFLTNASGGINRSLSAGDFMLITDHISTFVPNCLIGKNFESLGTRFPDMSHVYSQRLQDIIRESADSLNISLKEGIYVQLTGCSYETPAEIKMLSLLGADAVGMSTVCEAIAGKHANMEVCGISCITNMASGILDRPLNHTEVQEIADKVAPQFKSLLIDVISKLK